MFKAHAWVIAGAAVLASAGAAHAQERTVPQATTVRESAAVVPWYQRFTTSRGVTESITGESENDRILAPAWTLNQRWGMTLDVREAQRIERLPEGGHGNEASVGAYYQFTPRVRVGGQVSVETDATRIAPNIAGANDDETRAGVRVESAFRF